MNATLATPLQGRPLPRGACPSLDAPMQTGDGLLVRLSLACGGTSPDILRLIAELAARRGNGLLEISARGNLQVRGLTHASAEEFAGEIEILQPYLRTGLTVETNPLGDLDRLEHARSMSIASTISNEAEKANLKQRLAAKFSIIVDGGGYAGLHRLPADIRLCAMGGERWLLSLGGTETTARPVGSVTTSEAASAAIFLAEAIAKLGTEARGRHLPAERAQNLLARQIRTHQQEAESARGDMDDLEIGLHRRDGCCLAVFSPAYGAMESGALIALIDAAKRFASPQNDMRLFLLPGRLIAIAGLSANAVGELFRHPASAAFIHEAGDPRLGIVSCAGKPGCASAHYETKPLSERLIAQGLRAEPAKPVHLSGCAKGCARPSEAALHVVGTAEGIALSKNFSEAPAEHVSADEAASHIIRAFGRTGTGEREQ